MIAECYRLSGVSEHNYVGPDLSQTQCCGLADPACSACNNCYFPIQPEPVHSMNPSKDSSYLRCLATLSRSSGQQEFFRDALGEVFLVVSHGRTVYCRVTGIGET